MEIDQETVYGTHEDSYVMSEKVQSLANSIYQEFSRMIQKYDEDVVKDLVPLVVNVLECLDISYTETQEHEVELELLREDNEQLVTQYEREKQLRKASEQKCLEIEDAIEGENKELREKIESLESIVRMFELKSKNAADHVFRLEEKETENKKEFSKLHERYTELLKTHMDYMERTKILFGTDRLDQLGTSKPSLSGSQGRSGFGLSYSVNSMDAPVKSFESPVDFSSMTSPNRSLDSNASLKSELQEVSTRTFEGETGIKNMEVQSHEMSDKGQLTDEIPLHDRSTITRGGWVDNLSPDLKDIVNSTPELEDIEDISQDLSIGPDHRQTNISRARPNNLYQELTFQDNDALGDVDEGADITDSGSERADNDPEPSLDVNDNFFGMGKEVENLILENNELLATKNALNIVKDDLIARVDDLASQQEILRQNICSLEAVKEKLKNRVTELEDELKKMRDETQKNAKVDKSDDEEDVPMAQRKRFTRLEMARVLMERNQYKERFMELQEAVRWTEMIRASRTDPTLDSKKNRSTVWKFFSSLFSSSEKPQRKPLPYLNVKYNAPTHHVSPALDTMRKNLNDRRKGMDFLDSEIASEKLQAQKAKERREQYKQVRAHVKKDDGRMQAYGWSLPTKSSGSSKSAGSDDSATCRSSSHVPVPVPVYCRPLMEKQADMKIWCAAGVNLSGGRTRDGGNIVGTSVFYSNPIEDAIPATESEQTEIEKLNKELEEQMKELEDTEKNLSSLVWICTSNRNSSRVSVIDANNPADVLGSFRVCSSYLLCIASVPGAKESDYPLDEGVANASEKERKWEDVGTVGSGKSKDDETSFTVGSGDVNKIGTITFVSNANVGVSESPIPGAESVSAEDTDSNVEGAQDTSIISETRLMKEHSDIVKDGLAEVNPNNEIVCEEMEKMSSVLPTMWLGAQNGNLYVHSAVSQWRRCLHSVLLSDAVLSIVHVKGRVLVALADGTVAIFRRGSDGQWDLGSYHLLDLGKPYHSIRCMVKVHDSVWCGYRNKIHVVDPKTMEITKSFDAHPRKESQVRQMAWIGDGVWVSIRLDSTLRLYHASSYQHLQDVDIEPYVSKMLGTGKLGFSFVRITALLISSNRLWMGTSNGVIISVPLSESMKQMPSLGTNASSGNVGGSGGKAPGGVVRVYANPNETITPGSFIPYCSMAQAQLSFHGHRDAVKFFVSVPGSGGMSAASSSTSAPVLNEKNMVVMEQNEICVMKKPHCMLVVSGGEGYIDFRIGDGEEDEMNDTGNGTLDQLKPITLKSKEEPSHLIVWQVILA